MKTSTYVGSAIIVFISVFQLCPAPPLIIAGIAVAASMSLPPVIKHKRAETAAFGLFIRRYPVAWNACQNELDPVSVNVSFVGESDACFDGIPPACLNLAQVYLGGNPDGHASLPTLAEPSTLLYNNLTSDELKLLKLAVAAQQAPGNEAPTCEPPTSPAFS